MLDTKFVPSVAEMVWVPDVGVGGIVSRMALKEPTELTGVVATGAPSIDIVTVAPAFPANPLPYRWIAESGGPEFVIAKKLDV